MKRTQIWTLIAMLALSLIVFAASGCNESDGSSSDGDTEDGDSSDGDGDEPACEGSCADATTGGYCMGSNLCACEFGEWKVKNCNMACMALGVQAVGCGMTSTGNFDCLCDASDGDDPDGDDPDGDNSDGDDPDGDDPDGDDDNPCDKEGFVTRSQRAEVEVDDETDLATWTYTVYNKSAYPVDVLTVVIKGDKGGPQSPTTFTIAEADTSMATCSTCITVQQACNIGSSGTLTCARSFMPIAGATVSFTELGKALKEPFGGSFTDLNLQEVTIKTSNGYTTPVEDGWQWCLGDKTFLDAITEPGYVDMEKPTDTTCDYPDGPYHFMGPSPGQSNPEPGVVPPMEWPSAYYKGQDVGLDLAQYRCDHPEIKTLFVFVGAGWCPACRDLFRQRVCNDGGLEEELIARQSQLLYVIGQDAAGRDSDAEYADGLMDGYGCEKGIRISDHDNTAGFPVIFYSEMFSGIPWVSAIRMSDMKLIQELGDNPLPPFDYIGIAEDNMDPVVDGDTDAEVDGDGTEDEMEAESTEDETDGDIAEAEMTEDETELEVVEAEAADGEL